MYKSLVAGSFVFRGIPCSQSCTKNLVHGASERVSAKVSDRMWVIFSYPARGCQQSQTPSPPSIKAMSAKTTAALDRLEESDGLPDMKAMDTMNAMSARSTNPR